MTPRPFTPTPNIIAFAGDWHANTFWAAYAIKHAASRAADVIIQLGDYGFTYQPSFLDIQQEALAETGLRLLFVDGNHDNHGYLNRHPLTEGARQLRPRIWYLPRGTRWEWNGVRFLACGGAHSVDRRWRNPGVDWWGTETITESDVATCINGGPTDVIVSHDCPEGILIPGIDDGPPSEDFPWVELIRARENRVQLQRIVTATEPSHLFHGHYHRAYTQTGYSFPRALHVEGLDCDGDNLGDNLTIVHLADLMP